MRTKAPEIKRNLCVRLEDSQIQWINQRAKEWHTTPSYVIRSLIWDAMLEDA